MHDGLAYMESDGQSVIAPETAKCALPPFLVRLYGHDAAVGAPTKLTATQLKGRELDTEAADGAPPAELLHFPKPRFPEGERPLTPAERGTAIHLAMQFLRYENCGSRKEIEKELSRLGGIASGQTRARRANMKAAAREMQLRMVYFKDADADLKAEWAEFQRWRRSEKKRRVNAGKRGRKA